MESQDKEKEYQHSVWDAYLKEWETTSNEKRIELNKRMSRWQELMKDGLPASQAYTRTMQEEADKSPIYTAIEEEADYRVAEEPKDKHLAITSSPQMRKAPLIFLSLALVVAIIYSVVITGDRNALNTELGSVKSELTSVQSDLSSTKQTLASTQSDLSSTKQTLGSTQQTLASVQNRLEAMEAELKLYKETLGVEVFSNIKKIIEKGGGGLQEINLVDNPSAANPSWQELKEFLLADPTDDKTYIRNIFDCSQFAEMLHNKAEAVGIKSAFVVVRFRDDPIGHDLNAFKTTDKGLVYVDCTEWDKIAYVAKGKEYGAVSLGQNTPLDYASYEKMKADWDSYARKLEAYNEEVEEYNAEVSWKVYIIGSSDWWRINEWKSALEAQSRVLDNLRAQLEPICEENVGIVKSIKIYW